ncbi:hypothetical protein O181_002093 [Austropuccinia psidii MF-1]|uniref:Uncharacterized protein n=1 Tax=Austropuccinia psidii MF-1 TaxID=1389203 RepID=A0A9Q3BBS7_9BASI|nr:hypothetical protein [Austropuccinia psidii MF-1]
MAQTPGNSTEFNELQTSAPESGSEISDMASSRELGIEVESQSHEDNPDPPVLSESYPPSSQKPNFKSYEKEKTVEPFVLTEDSGQDDVIINGEVKIISKEQFVTNIAQPIPIDISEKISEDKNLVEPVWLCTNQYICNLLNQGSFSSESFNPTVPLRFEFAQCLVLDFGDAWVAKRGLGLSDEVTLTVPREVEGCVLNKAPGALGTILDSNLLSFKWQEAVSDILSASTQSDPSTTRE